MMRNPCFVPFCLLTNDNQHINYKYRRHLLNTFLRQDMRFFDRPENTTGALASKIDSHPQALLELMGFNIALILISTVGVLSCSVLALAYAWKLALVIVLGGLPPLLVAGYGRTRVESKMEHAISNKFSKSASLASESVMAIRTVSSLAIEMSVLDGYTRELDHAVALSFKPVMSIMFAFAFTQTVEHSFMALGFWCVATNHLFSKISLG